MELGKLGVNFEACPQNKMENKEINKKYEESIN